MKQYDKYKPSGVEWIGEVPEHWEVKKLKYIGDSIIGITYSPDDVSSDESGILVLRSSNIQHGKLSFEDNVYVNKEIQQKYFTQLGDILICARNGSAHLVGKSALITKEHEGHSFGAFMTILRSDYGQYLYFFFNSQIFKAQSGLFTTSTINQLTSDTLNNLLVTLPSEETEQTGIVNYLNKKTAQIDCIISKKQQLISLLKEERTAIINEAVSGEGKDWERKKLKYWLQSTTGGGTPSTNNSSYWNGTIPWVSPKDMKTDFISSTQDYITKEAIEDSSTSLIPSNRVIIVVRSGILKHTLPVAINVLPVTLNQDMKAFHPQKELNHEFLLWTFKGLQNTILTSCTKIGATVDSIEMEYLLNFEISVPDIPTQIEIITHVKSETQRIDNTISKIEKEITLLQEYRTALISEVVTGKVKVA